MTRAEAVLLARQGHTPPAPVTIKVRHRGKIRCLTIRLGPCGLTHKRETLMGAMGDDKNQVWDRVRYCMKHPNDQSYFSRYKLPKALEPWWKWWRFQNALRCKRRHDPPTRTVEERAMDVAAMLLQQHVHVVNYRQEKAEWSVVRETELERAVRPSYYSRATLRVRRPLHWIASVWMPKKHCVVTDSKQQRWLIVGRIGNVGLVSGPLDWSEDWQTHLVKLP